MNHSRRSILGAVAAFGALSAFNGKLLAAAPSPSRLLARARAELDRLGSRIPQHDVVALADFSSASALPRFHLLDMAGGRVTSLLVSHGRGSDPGHSGWLQRFSNIEGSAATSAGAYRTVGYYTGRHGRSIRLDGLDPTNSLAEPRAIVVHGASYVSAEMARTTGKIGRSEGCFAFAQADLPQVLDRLGPGRLIIADRF